MNTYEELETEMSKASQKQKVNFLNSMRDMVIKVTGIERPSDFDLLRFVILNPVLALKVIQYHAGGRCADKSQQALVESDKTQELFELLKEAKGRTVKG